MIFKTIIPIYCPTIKSFPGRTFTVRVGQIGPAVSKVCRYRLTHLHIQKYENLNVIAILNENVR